MSYDFINEMGILGIGPRLKRLGEAIQQNNRRLYQFFALDIEPSWILVIKLLEKYESLTVTQMAKKLHLSHPTLITMLRKMHEAQLVLSERDLTDSRKQFFKLSQTSLDRLSDWNRVWEANEKAIKSLIDQEQNLMEQIEYMEIRLQQESLMDRTIKTLNEERNVV